MNKDEVVIIMPAYNEQSGIRHTIEQLIVGGYHNIIVIDDCSKDDTCGRVRYLIYKYKEFNIILLGPEVNKGQGAALELGMRYVRDIMNINGLYGYVNNNGEKWKYVVHFDSDGQHQVSDIEKMIKPLENGFDITLGSRFIGRTIDMPRSRKFMLKIGIFVTWFISGIGLTDTHNGFRAMTLRTCRRLKIELPRMAHASEILDKVKSMKLKYKEVPVTILYNDEINENATASWQGSLKILWSFIKWKFGIGRN